MQKEDGTIISRDKGTPQGGVVSPILANVYLHYALDLWFEKVVKSHGRGEACLIDPAAYFGTGNNTDSSAWALQSILFASDRRIAVINGTRVKEGDRIGSARVVRIRDSQVLLDTGGRRLTLHLLPQTVKVRP